MADQISGRPSGKSGETKPPSAAGPQTPPGPSYYGLYWAFLGLLLLWNLWAFLPRQNQAVKLPYSDFVAQVSSGNVAKVHIVGAAISGTFEHAITWPQAPPSPAHRGVASERQPAETPAQGVTHEHTPRAPSAGAGASAHSASSSAHSAGAAASGHTASSSTHSAATGTPAPARYTSFRTTYPEIVGDAALMPLLRAQHVVVDVSTPSQPWFVIALTDGLPLVLMVVLLLWMGRQASRTQSGVFGFARNRARRYAADRPKVTFADVAGADEAKQDLTEVVDFLSHPSKYLEIGAHIPRGVLLVGPPGTGKTLLARAVAGEAGVPFFSISGSEFVEMFVGVGASRVRDLFSQAKEAQPAIVFVDELDAVGRRRGAGVGAVNDEREQTLNQLLVEMDGFDERQQVILLAATNRPDVLDPALLRPGRFDRQVVVPLPDWRGRQGILQIHTRHLRLSPDVNLEQLARTATGLSGADLANLCNEAALGAARGNRTEVAMKDFDEAWDKIVLGAARSTVLTPADRRVVAYHEGGHAVVAWFTVKADPVRKVTIVPHGRALGVTEQLPMEDRYNLSRADLLARLDVMLGGRTSEALVIGEITTGAENDLIQATRLARRMIARWGMGSLGPVAFDSEEEQPFLGYQISHGRDYSEETGARIDREVQQLLADRQKAVQRLLTEARNRLDALANRLLAEETVGFAELTEVLGPRPDGTAAAEPAAPSARPAEVA
jgi:cell division protease FtsH